MGEASYTTSTGGDGGMIDIKCGECGHVADFEAFTLGDNEYQCPGCNVGFRIRKEGEAKVYDSGLIIPADKVVEVVA